MSMTNGLTNGYTNGFGGDHNGYSEDALTFQPVHHYSAHGYSSNNSNDRNTFLFTSESVGEGHPDKMCDQISDAILDAHLEQDPNAKVACEVATTTGLILVFGEITSKAVINYQKVVRDTIRDIGYDDATIGFDYKSCNVMVALDQQSPEISQGVWQGRDEMNIGAGDQGIMFGYATDETSECMPLTLVLAHNLNKKLSELRRNGTLKWSKPDSKAQVTIEYGLESGSCVPLRCHTIVMSCQHDTKTTVEQVRHDVMDHVIKSVIPASLLDSQTIYRINPAGHWVLGGPMADAGLTGRKIIVDTYGGWGAHGGGAFSGKDYTKVDRSAAYAARWVALSLVRSGLCKRVLVQLSYAIGIAEPLSITVFSFGTSKKSDAELLDIVKRNFDLRPGSIIKDLDLKKPIYLSTAKFGHFGNPQYLWEHAKPLVFDNTDNVI